MKSSEVKWELLFKKEFEKRINECPVIYLPLGLCEPHGHIAVFGLDTIKAEYLCEEAATRWGGIVAPTQGYQIHETGYHAPWLAEVAGNVNTYMTGMPAAPMLYFFLYQLRTFHNAGFKRALVISGHAGGNQEDFRLAAQAFMQESDMTVEVFTDPELTNNTYTGDHAGKYEISQLMFLKPEYIDLERLSHWKADIPESRFAQGFDACEATADFGREIMETCLEGIRRILYEGNFRKGPAATRRFMTYETVEKVWLAVKGHAEKWLTAKRKPEQDPTPDNSFWKPFEDYNP